MPGSGRIFSLGIKGGEGRPARFRFGYGALLLCGKDSQGLDKCTASSIDFLGDVFPRVDFLTKSG